MECLFQNDLSQLLPDLEIELEYSPGFHTEQGLMQDLLNQHQKTSNDAIPNMAHIVQICA